MKNIVGMIFVLLILMPFTMAYTEEKVVSVEINATAKSETNNETNEVKINLKLFTDQNSYDWQLTNLTDESKEFTFFAIRGLECATDDITNLTKEFIAECRDEKALMRLQAYDEEGLSYKMRYEGVRANYLQCQDDKLNSTDFEKQYNDCDKTLGEKITALDICIGDKDKCEGKGDYWWMFLLAGLVAGGAIAYFFMNNKERAYGPQREFPRYLNPVKPREPQQQPIQQSQQPQGALLPGLSKL